ncbi:MAG: hypothetical protein D6689_03090 [Deltaproteobacteria bacterium]|nr:MAG: hypothetical protein D6689_03090 [Deltaproteobacteria bacterium]
MVAPVVAPMAHDLADELDERRGVRPDGAGDAISRRQDRPVTFREISDVHADLAVVDRFERHDPIADRDAHRHDPAKTHRRTLRSHVAQQHAPRPPLPGHAEHAVARQRDR